MTSIIAEDEAVAARRMQKLLEENELQVIEVCKSVKQICSAIEKHGEPDIYFFDIHLSDGLVFELFDKIQLDSPVVFTTAYDQYAIKAFKQNSIDYLLKPIDKKELQNAIAKYRKQKSKVTNPALESISAQLLRQLAKPEYKERVMVKIGDRLKSILISEVNLVYSESKITFLLTKEGRRYPIDSSLDELTKALDPKDFFRINRSTILRFSGIKDVISYSNSRLKIHMQNYQGEDLIVARDRVKDFKNWLG